MKAAFAAGLLLAACAGPPGPAGPSGPPGDPGAGATGRLVWRDATGAVVGFDAPLYQDGAGLLWSLDVETARPPAAPAASFHQAAACAGDAFVVPPAVGVPLLIGSTWMRRPAGLQSADVQAASVRFSDGTCSATTFKTRLVRADSMVPAAEPTWAFVPPLGVERAQ